jgi:hypothetical protein
MEKQFLSRMGYEPLFINVHLTEKDWRHKEKVFERCPGLEFYLKPLGKVYPLHHEPRLISEILSKWETSSPRPIQRMEALSEGDEEDANPILHGRISGTGKTTVAHEWLWRKVTCNGKIRQTETPAIAMTGHEFARIVAAKSLELEELMDDWISADALLLDDLDKRGDREGRYSPAVQQALFDLIESRTTRGKPTCLTLNSNGEQLLEKFGDDIGEYLLRRLRERFTAIDFDPVIQSNIIRLKGNQIRISGGLRQ